jgi:hypothetical protein
MRERGGGEREGGRWKREKRVRKRHPPQERVNVAKRVFLKQETESCSSNRAKQIVALTKTSG